MHTPFIGRSVLGALVRARLAVLTMLLVYVVTVTIGAVMVRTGNTFALHYRDTLVAQANAQDPAAIALHRGDRWAAALWDAARNLGLGAIPSTVAGPSILVPYLVAGFRGWVGGIVSVDDAHASRLATLPGATYYLLTLLLQLIPYALAGGAGVNLGIAWLRPRAAYPGARWFGLPKEAIWDAARIYLLVMPLFLLASLWEFLAA